MLRRHVSLLCSRLGKRLSSDAKIVENTVPPQTSNRVEPWSRRQRPKSEIITGPRFTQVDIQAQPNPPAAIEFIKADPIRFVDSRTVNCSGDGPLGHPKVFINLDNGQVAKCGYCGRGFQQQGSHH